MLTPYDYLLILINCGCAASHGLSLVFFLFPVPEIVTVIIFMIAIT